jgi:hypothetical protein
MILSVSNGYETDIFNGEVLCLLQRGPFFYFSAHGTFEFASCLASDQQGDEAGTRGANYVSRENFSYCKYLTRKAANCM